MKAVICTKYGPPEVLQFAEIAKPVPKDNEVLIKIKATTVAVADSRIRSFNVPPAVWLLARLALGLRKPRKAVLGVELAGEIESAGKDVRRFKVGDHVFAAALKNFGAYAEYTCLPEDDPIASKPNNLTHEEAAALPIGARTALHFLEKANITKGQKVLIYGASGSVGTYAVQLAKYFGAYVTAVCSGKNTSMVRSLGAYKVIDYTVSDFTEKLELYDVVFVAIDKFPFSACNQVLKKNGVYLNCTNPIKSLQQLWISLTTKKKVIMSENVPEKASYLIRIKELVEEGVLKPVIDKSYSFQQIIEAHRYVDKGHKKGNVVITLN
jgi:NADPH:quinone reductase-like Zn-dependent oxidoreductase